MEGHTFWIGGLSRTRLFLSSCGTRQQQRKLTPRRVAGCCSGKNLWLQPSVKTLCWCGLVLSLLLQPAVVSTTDTPPSGFCQIYSYNVRYDSQRLAEKHMFVCCTNPGERSCRNFTYQKPSRSETFCSGPVIQETGNVWTQKETSAFVNDGQFYCGDCCGQHLAWEACNRQFQRANWPKCMNWAQCYHRECRTIVKAVVANQALKCSLPPAPLPRHFLHETRTLPANVSIELSTRSPRQQSQGPKARGRQGVRKQPGTDREFTCGEKQCRSLPMDARCRLTCCENYCCLPDGPLEYHRNGNIFEGLTTAQIVGIAIGAVALMTAVITIVILVMKRCLPGCKHTSVPSNDTQILVIEGPDEVDSDQDIEDA